MFGGFDPARRDPVFERRRGASTLIALGIYLVAGGYGVYLHYQKDKVVDVLLEPEIKDFATEEAPEPEPEPEEEAPPPPPEPQPKPKVERPKPKPKLIPDKLPDGPPPEQDKARDDKAYGSGQPGSGGSGSGKGDARPEKKPEAEKKPEPPKPKPKVEKIDPTVPIDRPERSTPPKPDPGNAVPEYPKSLRDQGVEGQIVIKLHVANDGSVKGMKVLRKTNNATGDEAQEAASKLFLKAVVAAVKTWKYTPCKYQGQAISVWIPVTIPFTLKGG